MAYINHGNGTKSKALTQLPTSLTAWCKKRNIAIEAVHLSGKLNVIADEESRAGPDANDWKWNPSVIDRIKYGLQDKGLLIFDAFRAFNSSNTGLLTCSEFYGGMDFLDIPFKKTDPDLTNESNSINNDKCVEYFIFNKNSTFKITFIF